MKRHFISLLALLGMAGAAQAQMFVEGDVNQDGKITVSDVTKLVSMLNGTEAVRTPEMLIAGTWRTKDGQSITLNANGTTTFRNAKTFKYKNAENAICFYNASGTETFRLDVMAANAAYLRLGRAASGESVVYYSADLFPSQVTISESSLNMQIGDVANLTAQVYPETAFEGSYVWSSSNSSVATVDRNGNVTAAAPGTAVISATSVGNPSIKATCSVEVKRAAVVGGWTFTSVSPAQGDVSSLDNISLNYPAGTWITADAPLTINCPDGKKRVTAKDNLFNCLIIFNSTPTFYRGTYTLTIPAGSLLSGDGRPCGEMTYTWNLTEGEEFTGTIGGGEEGGEEGGEVGQNSVNITLDITKASWETLGYESGESIGTVTCDNESVVDHYSFYLTCDEDPEQFISFSDLNRTRIDNGEHGIVCYTPTGSYDLYSGQHYTLKVYAYDTPQYGAKPIGETTYHITGTGKQPIVYNTDIDIVSVGLEKNALGLGYDYASSTIDITFSAPVSGMKSWWAMGQDGSIAFTAKQKNALGTVWTITMTEDVASAEGAINVNFVATDSEGHQLKAACDNHPYAFNVVVSLNTEE